MDLKICLLIINSSFLTSSYRVKGSNHFTPIRIDILSSKDKKRSTKMYNLIAQQAVLGIVSHVFFIGVSFYALRAVMLEKLLKKNHVLQVQILYIFLSIVIGTSVSNFFLTISNWSNQLPYLFQ